MKISIIIPIYNAEKYLENCLKSIERQTYTDIEVLLINDGSTDESEAICKAYISKDARFKYFKINNHGVGYARNLGIDKSTGEFLCFVDADDYVSERFCEVLISNMEKYNADLSVCNYIELKKIKDIDNKRDKEVSIICGDEIILGLFNKYEGFLCNKMYKKSIIIDNNLRINEELSMCEDLVFNMEYLKNVKQVTYTKDILYGYIIHSTNASRRVSKKWFSVLKSISIIYENINNYSDTIQNSIAYFVINNIYETKIKSEILKIDYEFMLKQYGINYSEIKRKYTRRILFDRKISLKKKAKIIIYDLFFPIIKKIKVNKLLGGNVETFNNNTNI